MKLPFNLKLGTFVAEQGCYWRSGVDMALNRKCQLGSKALNN